MLKRKATTFIKNWLDTKDKKCLVVQGARQTGKPELSGLSAGFLFRENRKVDEIRGIHGS